MLRSIEVILADIGNCLRYFNELFMTLIKKGCRSSDLFDQIWKVTEQSLATTAFAGFFVGAIMCIQFTLQMNEFGALGFLGGLATSATIREVGPLLIAFMLAGKVGAFTSAELGTMRVTEQIDAIRCLGADPYQEILLPRFFAIIISSFFLLAAGLMMSIFGGMFLGQLFSGVNAQEYMRHIPTLVSGYSLIVGALKCLVFASILALICTYKGFSVRGGAKGVGKAVVQTAVSTMVCLVVADAVTSFLFDLTIRFWSEIL